MIHHRTRDLFRILGAIVVVLLPLLFLVVTLISSLVPNWVHFHMVNLPAYIGAAAVAGLVGFNLYHDQSGPIPRLELAWKVTSRLSKPPR